MFCSVCCFPGGFRFFAGIAELTAGSMIKLKAPSPCDAWFRVLFYSMCLSIAEHLWGCFVLSAGGFYLGPLSDIWDPKLHASAALPTPKLPPA